MYSHKSHSLLSLFITGLKKFYITSSYVIEIYPTCLQQFKLYNIIHFEHLIMQNKLDSNGVFTTFYSVLIISVRLPREN